MMTGRHPESRRIDIDLLRAIAVLAVILFHFEVPGFSGGFLGVDMFFVISGYLITLHIRRQLDVSTFSFMSFYLRRIRRLFPALAATLVLSSIGALFLLPQSLLQEFSHSLIASAVYVSNIFFWSIADYFDTERIYKPLLHIWSLSVEEQFYIFWPLIIVFFFKRRLNIAIITAGLVSLVAALFLGLSSSIVFYQFPFRIFEFAIGALISRTSLSSLSRQVMTILAVTALVGIGIAFMAINEHAPTPNWGTAVVTIGTAVIISLSHPQLNTNRFYFRPFLRIGLISYSAYLVHWPFVVFYKIKTPGPLSASAILMLFAATFLLAEVFYRYIENPTSRIDLSRRKYQLLAILPVVLLFAMSFNSFYPTVYKYRLSDNVDVKNLLDHSPDGDVVHELAEKEIQENSSGLLKPDRKTIAILGDSHAADLALSLRLVMGDDNVNVVVIHSNCDPLTMQSISISQEVLYKKHPQQLMRKEGECSDYHMSLLDQVAQVSPNLIIFSEAWRSVALPFLAGTITEMKAISPAWILILGRVPQFSGSPQVIYKYLQNVPEINEVAWSKRDTSFDEFDTILRGIAKKTGVYFLSKRELICPEFNCNIQIGPDIGYWDTQHWTPAGMKYYGNVLVTHDLFQSVLIRK